MIIFRMNLILIVLGFILVTVSGFDRKQLDISDEPQFFSNTLRKCKHRRACKLRWENVGINGTALTNLREREAFGKLMAHFTGSRSDSQPGYRTNIRLHNDVPNLGTVMGDVIGAVPRVKKIEHILLKRRSLLVKFRLPDYNGKKRRVWMYGFFDPQHITQIVKTFTENFSYNGGSEEIAVVELNGVTKKHVPDPSVLDRLLMWNIAVMKLMYNSRPSYVLSPLLMSYYGIMSWKQLWVYPAIFKEDTNFIDNLRRNSLISDECEVWVRTYPNPTKLRWLSYRKKFNWHIY